MDGDMVLNDVGAQKDYLMNDVSRGWPCNGKFSDRQRLLYECALQTSNHKAGDANERGGCGGPPF